ncbi:ARPP-1 family domain-containing protein [Actinomadura napierensis]|uniref:ARG and Rhodanese-Phosphatase-superfamily-associated domain-containing protein n=1 Tax=Actinomadura napierensis TaxID=267854 RepID=A0ABP5M8C7_9ACTN
MTDTTALDTLVPGPLSLAGHRLGTPQRAGALTMVPISGPARPGFVPPRTGLKLSRVTGYGRLELRNGADTGVAIVPLHLGYVQDAAQNHALCRSAFLAPGQCLLFEDACCVQQTQGGYLTGRDQWFFVLPVELRARALQLRGVHGYAKLWDDIADLNHRCGLPRRGHLEQILSRKRPVLTQFQSRLEPQPGQVGALFFVAGRFAGLEICPDPRYFAEMWTALVCFAYGVAAWRAEPAPPGPHAPAAPFEAAGLAELRGALDRDRAARIAEIAGWPAGAPGGPVEIQEEERYLDLRLSTLTAPHLAGQVVTDGGRTVYASLFAR